MKKFTKWITALQQLLVAVVLVSIIYVLWLAFHFEGNVSEEKVLLVMHLPQLISIGTILVIGVLILVVALVFWYAKAQQVRGLFLLSGFVLSCGIWFLIDYDYLAYYIADSGFVVALERLSLCFMPIFFLDYFLTVVKQTRTLTILFLNWVFLLLHQIVNLVLLFVGVGQVDTSIYFGIQLLVLIFSFVNVVGCMLYEFRTRKTRQTLLIFVTIILVLLGVMIDIFDYYLSLTEHGYLFHTSFLIALLVMLTSMIYYVIQQMREAGRSTALEKELLQSQIAVMLSQIKPHFIFNTLNAISTLCLTDPIKADETVITFSEYLRENINSLEAKEPITFAKELHHVENYVKIEQTRFGDKLHVEYNVSFEDFLIPTLTLQPIVENAIRHGIGKKRGSGTVWICAARQEEEVVITVRDDGVGFDMDSDYKRQDSIGMKNVKTRLREMVGATMSVSSSVGEGTITTIKVPIIVKEESV